jgi:hypothetical protein
MTNKPDSYDIEDKPAYRTAVRAMNARSRPPAILRFIMGALESYRQSRNMGWSRPWNKYGIMTFQSFELDFSQRENSTEIALLENARAVLADECVDIPEAPGAPEEANAFVRDLLSAENRGRLMGFIFVHEFTEDGQRYEGATLSFGRVKDKRFRDRLDLIVEAPVAAGGVGEFSRLRVFIDPFRAEKAPLWTHVTGAGAASTALFAQLSALSRGWAGDEARLWDHWTSAYIEYFGPRQWPVTNSHFFTEDDGRVTQRAQA